MKTILKTIAVVIFLFTCFSKSYSQGWAWARPGSGVSANDSMDLGMDICTDPAGNVYTIGYFYSSSIGFASTSVSKQGPLDAFVVKHNSSGVVQWLKGIGAPGGVTFGNAICADNSGNIFVTGTFSSSSITFDGGINLIKPVSTASGNMFLAKLNGSNGNGIWAKTLGGDCNGIEGNDVQCDSAGNVYAMGTFGAWYVDFGTGDTLNWNNSTKENTYLAKYDNTGVLKWYKRLPDDGYAQEVGGHSGLKIANDQSIYVAGRTSDLTTGTDIYVRKFDKNGNMVWHRSYGGDKTDLVETLTIDPSGNIYIAGNFRSTAIGFDAITLTNPKPNSEFPRYAVKLNNSGQVQWARILSNSTGFANGIASDNTGNIYLAGYAVDSSISGIPVTYADIIVYKLNPANGNTVWTVKAGDGFPGIGEDLAKSIAVTGNGVVYITGSFATRSSRFGFTLLDAGDNDMDAFVAKVAGDAPGKIIRIIDNKEIRTYPNPINRGEQLTIQTDEFYSGEFKIYNSIGQELQANELKGNSVIVNLPGGIYYYKITGDDQVNHTGRVMVK